MKCVPQHITSFSGQSSKPEKLHATPFSKEQITLPKEEYIQLKWEVNYWKSQHQRAIIREDELKTNIAELEAQIKDLKHRVFGKKSEKSKSSKDKTKKQDGSSGKRGQRPGTKGHGRTKRKKLPSVTEVHDLPEDEKCCPVCGAPLADFPCTEDSEIIEIEVKAYKRRIKRKCYKKTCKCESPGIKSAPPAPRLIKKSYLGISVWVTILLDKFLYARPTSRLLVDLSHHGLDIAQGTLTGGLQKIAPLFECLVAEFYKKQMTERLFHADETRWEVYEETENKIGHRWYLWVTQSPSVIYFNIDPTRAASVPMEHFANLNPSTFKAIVICDRYSAYKKLANNSDVIILAFCWAHVRRDFLDVARSWPKLEKWAFEWVNDIKELYQLNGNRLKQWDKSKPLLEQSFEFTRQHNALLSKLAAMASRYKQALDDENLHPAQKKVLNSLKNHWKGLTIFALHPEVAMDNNTAERAIRNPIIGRKGYYGSGAVWSAELASMMFTVFQTISLWQLNPRHWLTSFLQACAENGGRAPHDLTPFLPWKMSNEQKELFSRPILPEKPPPHTL